MHRQRLTPIVFAVAVLLAAAPAFAVQIEERFDQSYDLGPGGSIAVGNVNGSIQVEAWDRDEVRVEAVKKVKSGSRSKAEDIMERVEVVVEQRGSHLEIETRLPRNEGGFLDWLVGNDVNANVTYEIRVPRATDVEVDTVNGKVRIAGVAGRVEANTTNGGIEMAGLRGSVRAGTTNGGIDVELTEVTEGRDMRLSTTNGGISLRLPQDVRASVDADTTNGGIDIEGLRADVRSRGRRHVDADLNGGGPEIRLTTTNGGIRISGK